MSGSVTVLPGITIGEHAVVRAGSILIDDVPAKTGVLGYQCDQFGRWMSRTTAGAAIE